MEGERNVYVVIAENIKKERKRLGISQATLAERTDLSVDTIKSVESGRRSMSLCTYLSIAHALRTTPNALMSCEPMDDYIDRFVLLMNNRDKKEIEFALHILEEVLKGYNGMDE